MVSLLTDVLRCHDGSVSSAVQDTCQISASAFDEVAQQLLEGSSDSLLLSSGQQVSVYLQIYESHFCLLYFAGPPTPFSIKHLRVVHIQGTHTEQGVYLQP